MSLNKRKFSYLLFLILIFCAYYFLQKSEQSPDSSEYRVVEVIDGDTVIINDTKNSRVRYLGIDTPEIALQDSPGDPMSNEASEFNSELVDGKMVRLEFDEQKYDVYGRILANVYVNNLHVNEELLKEGLATVLIIEPNGLYSEKFNQSLDEAKNQKKGIWGDLTRLVAPQRNQKFNINPDKAERYEGKRVVVRGQIVSSRKSDTVLVLNMEDKLDVVIFPNDWDNFTHFGIEPESYYLDKKLDVIGRVKMHKGKPSIVVNHPMLLRSQF